MERGCAEQLLVIAVAAQRAVKKERALWIACTDFEKAYDTVDHISLLHVLGDKGLDRPSTCLLNMLISNHVSVCGEGEDSFRVEVLCGVLQGGLISPAEFDLFIDDLVAGEIRQQSGSTILGEAYRIADIKYADDTIAAGDSPSEIEKTMEEMVRWEQFRRMVYAPSKCFYLIVNPDAVEEVLRDTEIAFKGNALERKSEFVTLGMLLTEAGDLYREDAVATARTNLATVSQIWASLKGNLPLRSAGLLMTSNILASSIYGSEISSISDQDLLDLDRVSDAFARAVLGVPLHTRIGAMYEFLGWMRPSTRVMKRRLKLAIKVMGNERVTAARVALFFAITERLPYWLRTVEFAERLAPEFAVRLEEVAREWCEWWAQRSMISGNNARTGETCLPERLMERVDSLSAGFGEDPPIYLSKAVQEFEQAWQHRAVPGYGLFKNRNAQGSIILRKAESPGAAALFALRYCMGAHLARHANTRAYDHRCSCCSTGAMDRVEHIIFECRGDLLSPGVKSELLRSQREIRKYYDEFCQSFRGKSQSDYLQWLTGDEVYLRVPTPGDPRPAKMLVFAGHGENREEKKFVQPPANLILEAAVSIRAIRYRAYLSNRKHEVERQLSVQASGNRHPTLNDKKAIMKRLYQCRDVQEFAFVLKMADLTETTVSSASWTPHSPVNMPSPKKFRKILELTPFFVGFRYHLSRDLPERQLQLLAKGHPKWATWNADPKKRKAQALIGLRAYLKMCNELFAVLPWLQNLLPEVCLRPPLNNNWQPDFQPGESPVGFEMPDPSPSIGKWVHKFLDNVRVVKRADFPGLDRPRGLHYELPTLPREWYNCNF